MNASFLLEDATGLTCPAPFIALSNSARGGYPPGRLCDVLSNKLTCCLPCPTTKWLFSQEFNRKLIIAYWLNVPALACQVFLLTTFAALPKKESHGHYLNVVLCIAISVCELGFIIPLAARPDECYDPVTPRDMYSSLSCAFSGALLLFGVISAIVWILLRSIWTHLLLCWGVRIELETRSRLERIFSLGVPRVFLVPGFGLPGLFVAVTLTVTGCSYTIGTACLPNRKNGLGSWVTWLIGFASFAGIIQFMTIGFYLYPLLRKADWEGVKRTFKNQWRSTALIFVVLAETLYFAIIFIQQSKRISKGLTPEQLEGVFKYVACYAINNRNETRCGTLAQAIGLDENVIIAAYLVVALVGFFTFLLMVRGSMLRTWWNLLRNSRESLFRAWWNLLRNSQGYYRRSSADDNIVLTAAI